MSREEFDLVPGRECGECRVCCVIFAIDEPDLQKEAGERCSHICAAGCDIYLARPPTCSTFHCAWRQTLALPDHARPDRLGVLFYVTGLTRPKTLFDNIGLVVAAVDDPAALDSQAVQALIAQFAQSPLPIHARWDLDQVMIHPAPDLADAILNPETTPHRDLVEAGRAWLARYAPIARDYAGERVVLPRDY